MKKLKNLIKQTRFYIAISLMIQMVSSIFMVIFFLYKNKKNTAAAFSALSLASGIGSLIMLSRLSREQRGKSLLETIDELCFECPEDSDLEIPVDETACEEEFN